MAGGIEQQAFQNMRIKNIEERIEAIEKLIEILRNQGNDNDKSTL